MKSLTKSTEGYIHTRLRHQVKKVWPSVHQNLFLCPYCKNQYLLHFDLPSKILFTSPDHSGVLGAPCIQFLKQCFDQKIQQNYHDTESAHLTHCCKLF